MGAWKQGAWQKSQNSVQPVDLSAILATIQVSLCISWTIQRPTIGLESQVAGYTSQWQQLIQSRLRIDDLAGLEHGIQTVQHMP